MSDWTAAGVAAPDPVVTSHESRSSIEAHRDAKGIYSWTLKRYQGSPFDIDELLEDIEIVDAALRLKYTPSDPNLGPKLRDSIEAQRAKKEVGA